MGGICQICCFLVYCCLLVSVLICCAALVGLASRCEWEQHHLPLPYPRRLRRLSPDHDCGLPLWLCWVAGRLGRLTVLW